MIAARPNRRSLCAGALVLGALLANPAADAQERTLDLVITGGRVLDPETRLDAVRDVGVRDGVVVALSARPLAERLRPGGKLLRAAGLVVAPGFIDLHAHGQSNRANEFQAHDGVTTALELEWGYPLVGEWLESRRGRSRLNFGATVSLGMVRALVMPDLGLDPEALRQAARAEDPLRALQGQLQESFYRPLPDGKADQLHELLLAGLRDGALGIGMAHQYFPGADRREIFGVFQLAARARAPIFTHVRSMGIAAIQEVLADAAATGAPLHIVHVNSSSLRELPTVLEMIAGAQARGLDVTTEAYPYTAGSTAIQSAIFDDGWQELLGITYRDIQWQDTGERLTKETFERYRKQGGTVIIHMMPEEMIDLAMKTPFVIVASDGMPYAPGAHPRSAGTFSRVLGRWVRERGELSLMEAIERMTLMPARRLQGIAPAMARKGRIQVGADADLTVFDPETIIDTATFESELSFSEGVVHVLVHGVPVVESGETVADAFPGRAVRGAASAVQ